MTRRMLINTSIILVMLGIMADEASCQSAASVNLTEKDKILLAIDIAAKAIREARSSLLKMVLADSVVIDGESVDKENAVTQLIDRYIATRSMASTDTTKDRTLMSIIPSETSVQAGEVCNIQVEYAENKKRMTVQCNINSWQRITIGDNYKISSIRNTK